MSKTRHCDPSCHRSLLGAVRDRLLLWYRAAMTNTSPALTTPSAAKFSSPFFLGQELKVIWKNTAFWPFLHSPKCWTKMHIICGFENAAGSGGAPCPAWGSWCCRAWPNLSRRMRTRRSSATKSCFCPLLSYVHGTQGSPGEVSTLQHAGCH